MTRPRSGAAAASLTLDRPWRRPGALAYALRRLPGLLRPPVRVHEPPAGSVVVDADVAVPVRDGTVLRANVYRPPGDGPFPVLVCAHPYGKDNLPRRRRRRPGYRVSFQYRALRQTGPVRFSSLTAWEAPDPAWWTGHGYVVVNADLRGCGTSEGTGAVLSDQEGDDVFDLVQWAGAQPWSTGRVGMLGVSYLAISQYKAAALRPPSLRAICPWEGFTDAYRDLMRPGGIQERGFLQMWARGLREDRLSVDVLAEQRRRPLRDDWWRSLVPDLPRIDVPMLVCTSFSDNNLHSRGSFRAFQSAGSADTFAYTHRSGKWATFYSDDALAAQLAFFDRHLRDADVPAPPRLRLEVREDRRRVAAVRDEQAWPLARTRWRPLYLADGGRLVDDVPPPGAGTFPVRAAAAAFTWTVPADLELTGPMALHLWLESPDADDVHLVAGVEKWRGRRYVPFEGSYGFGRDRVATGWQKASLRAVDPDRSTPAEPVHPFDRSEPLRPGLVVPVDVALGPSATLFRAGDQLRLVVAGRWLWPANPLTGQFPARYERPPAGRCTLHWGGHRPAHLLVPEVPPPGVGAPGG
ncbi:MAG TPA: CocE/NonD family hydrolase [Acidimicrobiales bacterium]|nr:CocE/NonD family hydrolase [Acidimicrobiales bacterium]